MIRVNTLSDENQAIVVAIRCARFEADILAAKLRKEERLILKAGGAGNYAKVEVLEDERYARVFNDKKGFYVKCTFNEATLAEHAAMLASIEAHQNSKHLPAPASNPA